MVVFVGRRCGANEYLVVHKGLHVVMDRASAMLSRRADSSRVSMLIELLQDRRFELQMIAVSALAAIGDPAAIPHLVTKLETGPSAGNAHGSSPDRVFCAIASFHDPSTVDALARYLHRNTYVYPDEVAAFCQIDIPAVDDHLEALLATTTDRRKLTVLADAFEQRLQDAPAARRAEFAALRGDWEAAAAQGSAGVDGLLAAMAHSSSKVRSTALSALIRVPDARAIDALVVCMHRDHQGVYSSAMSALIKITDVRVVDVLLDLLVDHPDGDVRSSAAAELGRRGDPRAVEPLIQWLRDADRHEDRDVALRSLGKLGGSEAVDTLLTALTGPDRKLRWVAAIALGDSTDARAVPQLVQFLADPDAGWAAASALGMIGDRSAVPALCAMLTFDSNDQFRKRQRAAARALGQIGDPSALPALRRVHEGPVAQQQWRLADDDDGFWVRLDRKQAIHEAVTILEAQHPNRA